MSVEFRILGPVEVSVGGRLLSLGGPLSRRILALLLAHHDRLVTTQRIAEAAWGADLPATARRQVQNRVAALRTLLTPVDVVIETHNTGFRLRVRRGALDLTTFEQLIKHSGEIDDPRESAAVLRQALALWRGPALADLIGTALEHEATLLEEKRLAVFCECIDLELAADKHAWVLPQLANLVAENPFNERLVGQWMIALARAGRLSEAPDVYRNTRRRLIDELGVEPGAALRAVHHAILRAEQAEPDDDPCAGTPAMLLAHAPCQLPRDIAAFTGRRKELARLHALLAAQETAVPVTVVIHGLGGVGKSALALHVSHACAERFPDGQLYVDLQGATPGMQPVPPLEALGRFLRALGHSTKHAMGSVAEASALFRSVIAGQRILVVLDNARDAAQIRPLLPGSGYSATLVTSRQRLTGMEDVHDMRLDVMTEDEAVTQMAQTVGPARVFAESAAAAKVVRQCGYLPLALRIVGTRLAARPGWTLRALADRLDDAQSNLDELEFSEISLRASLAVSHQALSGSDDPVDALAASAFVMLGLPDGPDFGPLAFSRLLGQPQTMADRALERLIGANVIEAPSPERYRLHDLLRHYAREQAASRYDQQARATVLGRVFDFFAAAAWRASELIRPGDHRLAGTPVPHPAGAPEFRDVTEALTWFETEHMNLIAAVRQASVTDGISGQVAIHLSRGLFGFFRLRGCWGDAAEMSNIALAAAIGEGDMAAEAGARNDLGAALARLGRQTEAEQCLQQGLTISRRLEDQHNIAQAELNLGVVSHMRDHYDKALRHYKKALEIYTELSDARGMAMSLGNLGSIYCIQGMNADAINLLEQAVTIFQNLGDYYGQAVDLAELGLCYRQMGQYEAALTRLRESLAIYRDMGDRYSQVEVLTCLSVLHDEAQRHQEAHECERQAFTIRRSLNGVHDTASVREVGLTLRALTRESPVGCQKFAWPVSCSDD